MSNRSRSATLPTERSSPFACYPPGLAATFFCGALLVSLLGNLPRASAQVPGQPREYPPQEYYLSFRLIDQGDFVKGAQAFRSASRLGVRTSEGPWVDAICYHAMVGECLYQMGDLAQALEQFTSAQRLLVAHGNWMLRVEFPQTIDPRNLGGQTPVTWGATTRRTVPGQFPRRYPILQGQLDPTLAIRQGGVFALPEFFLINAHEVLRCSALAIRRRGEILGRTSPHDQLNERLIAMLTTRPAPPNHWSQAWIDALLGMAYSVTGRGPEAVSELTKSLQIGGQFDHPLTPMALQQLGRLAFQQAQYDVAAKFFLEASISATWFEQTDLMEEAFRWGTMTHVVTNTPAMNPVLEPALAWARRERSELVESSLLIQQAHQAVELSQTAAAAGLLEQARRAMARCEMIKGAMGARLNYVAALVGFQSGNLAAGETAWNAVMQYQTNPQRLASHRLFEINLVDALALSGNITPRVANDLYADVLREPTVADWTTSIVETLTTVVAPNIPAHEHWLAIARERGENERMIEIADRIRRLRFFSNLPMGGRLLALTWVLEGPKESLPERALLARQDLFARYPKYAEASRRAAAIRDQLLKLPMAPEDPSELKQQQQLFAELATLSQLQELILRELAVRREAADFLAPPPLDFKQFQPRLAPHQAILAFFLTSRNELYGFLIRQSGFTTWQVSGANKFGRDVTELLKQMGQLERNSSVELEVLQGEAWKPIAADVWTKITGGLKEGSLTGVTELAVVPDRWLWYLPFETLPAGASDGSPLLNRCTVRYVPTVSLALPDGRPASSSTEVAAFLGKTLSAEQTERIKKSTAQLRAVLKKVVEFQGSLPVPASLLGTICRRAIVFDDIDPQGKGVLDWAPFGIDRDKAGSSMGAWLALPWGAPELIVLPAFHTVAEQALKRNPTGDEIFLPACSLMAVGSRTILLSRWSTGGQTALDLVREFVQESPYQPAAAAWQRSVQLVREHEIDFRREPRVRSDGADRSVAASHPFFWAGYALISSF